MSKNRDVEDNKKPRQYRSNQGRSPKQIESTYKILGCAMLGMLFMLLYLVVNSILNSL